jgi:hypothetical protein
LDRWSESDCHRVGDIELLRAPIRGDKPTPTYVLSAFSKSRIGEPFAKLRKRALFAILPAGFPGTENRWRDFGQMDGLHDPKKLVPSPPPRWQNGKGV